MLSRHFHIRRTLLEPQVTEPFTEEQEWVIKDALVLVGQLYAEPMPGEVSKWEERARNKILLAQRFDRARELGVVHNLMEGATLMRNIMTGKIMFFISRGHDCFEEEYREG